MKHFAVSYNLVILTFTVIILFVIETIDVVFRCLIFLVFETSFANDSFPCLQTVISFLIIYGLSFDPLPEHYSGEVWWLIIAYHLWLRGCEGNSYFNKRIFQEVSTIPMIHWGFTFIFFYTDQSSISMFYEMGYN